jgi:hypothetical protein
MYLFTLVWTIKFFKFLMKFNLQNVIPIFWYTYKQSANVFAHSISLVCIKGKTNLISPHNIVQLFDFEGSTHENYYAE